MKNEKYKVAIQYLTHIRSVAEHAKGYIKQSIRARFKSKAWRSMEIRPPSILYVETTNICNANCIFCAYQYNKKPKGIMSMELFKQAVSEYVDGGGDFVAFAPMNGDPSIDPFILERLFIIKEETAIKDCYMITNGILLDKVGTTELLCSGIKSIFISTAGFDKDVYQRIYRSNSYDRVIRNIEEILKKNCEMGKPVKITVDIRSDEPVRVTLNKKDFKERISPYLDKKNLRFLIRFDDWGGLIKKVNLTGNMKLAKPKRGKRPCSRTFSAYITWDGKVRACGCRSLFEDEDDLMIGDLRKSSLKDIWYGDSLRELRRRFERDDIPKVCQNCSMYDPV